MGGEMDRPVLCERACSTQCLYSRFRSLGTEEDISGGCFGVASDEAKLVGCLRQRGCA